MNTKLSPTQDDLSIKCRSEGIPDDMMSNPEFEIDKNSYSHVSKGSQIDGPGDGSPYKDNSSGGPMESPTALKTSPKCPFGHELTIPTISKMSFCQKCNKTLAPKADYSCQKCRHDFCLYCVKLINNFEKSAQSTIG